MDNPKKSNGQLGAFATCDSDYLQVGLTKREYMATQFLAARLSYEPALTHQDITDAVGTADTLLKALEE